MRDQLPVDVGVKRLAGRRQFDWRRGEGERRDKVVDERNGGAERWAARRSGRAWEDEGAECAEERLKK